MAQLYCFADQKCMDLSLNEDDQTFIEGNLEVFYVVILLFCNKIALEYYCGFFFFTYKKAFIDLFS